MEFCPRACPDDPFRLIQVFDKDDVILFRILLDFLDCPGGLAASHQAVPYLDARHLMSCDFFVFHLRISFHYIFSDTRKRKNAAVRTPRLLYRRFICRCSKRGPFYLSVDSLRNRLVTHRFEGSFERRPCAGELEEVDPVCSLWIR